jgi:hypothetical protein
MMRVSAFGVSPFLFVPLASIGRRAAHLSSGLDLVIVQSTRDASVKPSP